MRRYSLCVRLALCAIVCLGSAIADPSNLGPPVGAILDLAGQPISGTFTQYTVDFTAGVAFTDITFALRNDPAWTAIDDVSVVDVTTPAGNLIVNGGFETGAYAPWDYDNVYGLSTAVLSPVDLVRVSWPYTLGASNTATARFRRMMRSTKSFPRLSATCIRSPSIPHPLAAIFTSNSAPTAM